MPITVRTRMLQACYRRGFRKVWWHFVANTKIFKVKCIFTGRQKYQDDLLYILVTVCADDQSGLYFPRKQYWVLPEYVTLRI